MRDPFGPPDYQLPWANFPSERSNPIRHLLTWRRLMPHYYFDIKDGHTHAELLLAFLASIGFKPGDFITTGMNEKRTALLRRVLNRVTHPPVAHAL